MQLIIVIVIFQGITFANLTLFNSLWHCIVLVMFMIFLYLFAM